jgi:hypothetical protein
MTTVIITKNGAQIKIPYSDWNFSLVAVNNILITDQISKKTIGNIRYENIAGIYTENKNRIKKYEDGEDGE